MTHMQGLFTYNGDVKGLMTAISNAQAEEIGPLSDNDGSIEFEGYHWEE